MKFILQPIVGNEHPVLPAYQFEKISGSRAELYEAIVNAMEFGISANGIKEDLMYSMVAGYMVRGEDKRIIGTCVLANVSNQLNVVYLWVAELYRRQHIGENLVNLAILRAKRNDYYSLYASVRDDRAPAIALFTKLGFVIDPDPFKRDTLIPKQERLIP